MESEPLKEVYVFEDKDNPEAPIVLHFPLVNVSFKQFKAPGKHYNHSLHPICHIPNRNYSASKAGLYLYSSSMVEMLMLYCVNTHKNKIYIVYFI